MKIFLIFYITIFLIVKNLKEHLISNICLRIDSMKKKFLFIWLPKKEKQISYINFVQNYYKSLYFPPWMNHYIDINSNNHDIHVGWWSRCMINKHFCLHTINKLTNWKHISMNLHRSIDVPPNKVGLPFTRHSLMIECLVKKQILIGIQSSLNPLIAWFLIFLVENLTPPTHERILYVQSWVLKYLHNQNNVDFHLEQCV